MHSYTPTQPGAYDWLMSLRLAIRLHREQNTTAGVCLSVCETQREREGLHWFDKQRLKTRRLRWPLAFCVCACVCLWVCISMRMTAVHVIVFCAVYQEPISQKLFMNTVLEHNNAQRILKQTAKKTTHTFVKFCFTVVTGKAFILARAPKRYIYVQMFYTLHFLGVICRTLGSIV